jgi:hypothetical protein
LAHHPRIDPAAPASQERHGLVAGLDHLCTQNGRAQRSWFGHTGGRVDGAGDEPRQFVERSGVDVE